ncbi:CDGSH iron-sulfur domain-containing protein [Sphaerisporangium cinnabarinum]|nr:CDGSH iron-sulfur domain-containing protein [Sphaerisporangium cinnabarinum]PTU55248.1 CDGSH iron-sulfur domain-containing protein [Sphaerisporangium cinnabarinum]
MTGAGRTPREEFRAESRAESRVESRVEEVTVTACPDGPLLVRGPARLVDQQGREIERHRATVALCRCGGTAIPPWCDGTHKVNGYRSGEPDDTDRGTASEGGTGA